MPFSEYRNWFAGLKTLSQADFPKHCGSCGRVYQSEVEYFRETLAIRPERTGLKSALDDDDATLVELYRNCVCGSTLMAFFSDRRDPSTAGHRRRHLFDDLLAYLLQNGIEPVAARSELLKVIHGERSELLESWHARVLTETGKNHTLAPTDVQIRE